MGIDEKNFLGSFGVGICWMICCRELMSWYSFEIDFSEMEVGEWMVFFFRKLPCAQFFGVR